jgi:hypothetical protein
MRNPDWRWGEPKPAPDFAMFPGFIFRDILREMSGSETKVFMVLVYEAYRWRRDVVGISTRRLAEYCGLARSTAIKAIDSLVAAELVELVDLRPVGANETAVYRLRLTEDPRYTSHVRGPKIGPGGGPKIGPPLVRFSNNSPLVSPDLYMKERSKERGDTSGQKYFRGRYAVCTECGSRPCVCEE